MNFSGLSSSGTVSQLKEDLATLVSSADKSVPVFSGMLIDGLKEAILRLEAGEWENFRTRKVVAAVKYTVDAYLLKGDTYCVSCEAVNRDHKAPVEVSGFIGKILAAETVV